MGSKLACDRLCGMNSKSILEAFGKNGFLVETSREVRDSRKVGFKALL